MCFFSFAPTHFSFSRAFWAHWAGGNSGGRSGLMERATWTNPVWNQAARPSQIYDSPTLCSHTEAPLLSFWMHWTLSITFCHLCLSLLPLPCISHISIPLFLMSTYLPPLSISHSSISFSLYPFLLLPDILASCSSRQCVYSCLCNAELQFKKAGCVPFPNTSSLHSIHDLSMTLTPLQQYLQNHPHTLHGGKPED